MRKIYLVRHGRTFFNIANDEAMVAGHSQQVKDIWKSTKYIDTQLHSSAYQQLDQTAELISKLSFSHVFISPMFRTQQTAQYIFKNHPDQHKIKFILFPSITEILVTLGELQIENHSFPNFDNSLLNNKTGSTWQLEIFKQSSRYNELLQYTKGSLDKEQIIQGYQKLIDKYFPLAAVESVSDLSVRVNKSKDEIKQIIKPEGQKNNICLVSHWATLKCFTSNWIKDAYKNDGIDFINGEMKMFDESLLDQKSRVVE